MFSLGSMMNFAIHLDTNCKNAKLQIATYTDRKWREIQILNKVLIGLSFTGAHIILRCQGERFRPFIPGSYVLCN